MRFRFLCRKRRTTGPAEKTRLTAALEKLVGLSSKMLLAAALCGLAWSQTGLTTIQDTLFKADGTKFNGTLTIHWVTFDSANNGTVVQQSTSVTVVNGNLLVQLVPNAAAQPPANVYSVSYQSDGREQFAETWTVPVSGTPLKVAAVRIGIASTSNSGTSGTTAGNQTPITEATVIGLVADLAERPLKGVGFGTDRVAIINDSGQIETVVGDVGDCVFVDGTSGPCGQPTFADAETPGGIVDGTNNTLTLAYAPLGSSLMLFRNGLYLTPGFDYMLNGTSVQFVAGATPQAGDRLTASYRVDTSSSGDIGGLNGAPGLRTAATQVLCSQAGTSTSSTMMTSLGMCDIPAAGLQAGDRIEVRFTFSHTGTNAGINFQINWGNTTLLARSGSAQDSAIAGVAEAAITGAGAQISVQSWGTVLSFLPGILNAPAQAGLSVDFRASMAQMGSDSVTLTNFTVLRYPAN
jgi:hypothetical protein